MKQTHEMAMEVVEHISKVFQVVPHRGKVERTLAWLLNDRRHSRDEEVLTTSREVMMHISIFSTIMKWLA